MCGILGMVDFIGSSPVVREEAARRALGMIAHRGSDDEGLWWNEERTAFLGHRRLSIIDLSAAGHQPMANEDGSVVIAYNGEVYNFAELRAELEARGHVFRSRTDTEAILQGYEEFGDAVVERLRGMFAFAIHDRRHARFVLARDRLGIKPLYYAQAGTAFAVASEIRPLFELARIERRIDARAFSEYIAFGKVYPPRTMFEGVSKFPAAHVATIDASGMRMRRYWTPYDRRDPTAHEASEEVCARRVAELLEESVRLRMLSDVPVGVFLSGGVDSTANVAMMSRAGGGRVHTFTAGFAGQAAYDERVHARAAAAHFNTEHEEIEITERDLLEELPRVAGFLDEPVADPTVIPIYFLSKLARSSGTIVILNGDGGDELFCGYRKYMRMLKVAPAWRAMNMLPTPVLRLAARAAGLGSGMVNGRGAIGLDLLDRASREVEMYIGSTGPLKGTRAFAAMLERGGDAIYDAVRAARSEFDGLRLSDDYAEWLSYWGLRSEIEHVFLYRADRMGMANSIEIRVPFLDHHLVEFAMQMPQALKYRGGETKYILKRALEGIVPHEFLHRRKQGFCVPVREWGGGLMDDRVRATLPRLRDDWGIIDRAFVDDVLAMLGGAGDRDGTLSWMLYNLSVWYDEWFG